MEKVDYSIIKCKGCGELKTRYRDCKFDNKKDTRWVDENGRQFSGKMCPSCHADRVALNQRNRRNQNKILKEALESK